MQRISQDQEGTYLAWCQAQDLLLRGKYRECKDLVSQFESQAASPELSAALLEAYEQACGKMWEQAPEGSAERDAILLEELGKLADRETRDQLNLAADCYYEGRAYERAGQYDQAEKKYLKCLKQRPSRLLGDSQAREAIFTPVIMGGVAYAGSGDRHLRAFDLRKVKPSSEVPFVWSSEPQFWSWIIWGQGGLAASKIADRFPLEQILNCDHWTSADLAAEIDRLARLGDWNEEEALAADPATLCPPELVFDAAVRDAQGGPVRPAAQVYSAAARSQGGANALEYATEAARLAPNWTEA